MKFLQSNRLALLLTVNVVVMGLVLLLAVNRDGRSMSGSSAFGQGMPMPANASGLTIMPGQLSPNTWGCYVMDPFNETLSVYQFSPGEHNLKLAAARDIRYDRRLKMYNTTPDPQEIRQMLDRADEPSRAAPTTNPAP